MAASPSSARRVLPSTRAWVLSSSAMISAPGPRSVKSVLSQSMRGSSARRYTPGRTSRTGCFRATASVTDCVRRFPVRHAHPQQWSGPLSALIAHLHSIERAGAPCKLHGRCTAIAKQAAIHLHRAAPSCCPRSTAWAMDLVHLMSCRFGHRCLHVQSKMGQTRVRIKVTARWRPAGPCTGPGALAVVTPWQMHCV